MGGLVMITLALALAQTPYTDHGNPTADEQRVLFIINRARTDPFAEGTRLMIPGGITEGLSAGEAAATKAQPPLAMNAKLRTAARDYAQFMWDNNFFAHNFPTSGPPSSTPGSRITAASYSWTQWAENLATGSGSPYDSAEELQDLLTVDAGVAGRGHRTNMLDIYVPGGIDPGPRREVGIGYLAIAAGADKSNIARHILVQDFGEAADAPFLVGTVYLDANGDNEYDLGEGLGGVEITVTGGTHLARSASAGGYAFPCPTSGSRTISAAGTSLPATVSAARTFNSSNQLFDVRVPPQTDTDADGLPDYWETRFGGALAPGGDGDGDGFTNLAEFRAGSDPTNGTVTPPPPPPPPPPPSGGGGSGGGGGGGCGLTGFEVALLALVLRARRRV